MRDQWLKESDVILLLFAVNDHRTFEECEQLRRRSLNIMSDYKYEYKKLNPLQDDNFHDVYNKAMILVGTKNDLRFEKKKDIKKNNHNNNYLSNYNYSNRRFVSTEEAIQQAKEWKIPYIETSAKNSIGVDFLFQQIPFEYWLQSQVNQTMLLEN